MLGKFLYTAGTILALSVTAASTLYLSVTHPLKPVTRNYWNGWRSVSPQEQNELWYRNCTMQAPKLD